MMDLRRSDLRVAVETDLRQAWESVWFWRSCPKCTRSGSIVPDETTDAYYNLVKPHKRLHLPSHEIPDRKWLPELRRWLLNVPIMFGLFKELLTLVLIRNANHT